MRSLLRSSVYAAALLAVVFLSSIASAQKMQVAVVLDEPNQEFYVISIIFPGTPVDPDWLPQDPGDEILGLSGIVFDVVPSGGLVIDSATSEAPQDYPMGFWLWNYATPLPSGAVGINAFQATIFQITEWVWEGVGLPPLIGENPPWGFPVLLAHGTYHGEGGLDVEFQSFIDSEDGHEYTYVSMLYGNPLIGWFDAAKVDAVKLADLLTFPASTTQ